MFLDPRLPTGTGHRKEEIFTALVLLLAPQHLSNVLSMMHGVLKRFVYKYSVASGLRWGVKKPHIYIELALSSIKRMQKERSVFVLASPQRDNVGALNNSIGQWGFLFSAQKVHIPRALGVVLEGHESFDS